jgi:glutamate dehydrogenase (NADP+)
MSYASEIMEFSEKRNPGEREFHQAVREVLTSLEAVLDQHPEYRKAKVLERMVEPERVIMFRIPWVDDKGVIHINRGLRVEFSSVLGPYKGGLRFHASVNLGILKFLGFEQMFKNALTTLPLGGGKGGSDFDPKGKSDDEVMRFCQSLMTELHRHIGANTDVPAGDIGVGFREIGYMFGQYKRIRNEFTGCITGKGLGWGGSLIRPEATGYGSVYFAEEMLATRKDDFSRKVCTVSGSGNVAQYTIEKLIELGAKCVSLSDSDGTIYDPDGITTEKLDYVMNLKNVQRGRMQEYTEKYPKSEYKIGERPWSIPCDCAFPSATENELSAADAKALLQNGCQLVAEGANMPTEPDAVELLLAGGVLFGPGKAANAGGVAVSGLEMAQNAQHSLWTREEVDMRLRDIMRAVHRQAAEVAEQYDAPGNYVVGANTAGFVKIADAMLAQGLV